MRPRTVIFLLTFSLLTLAKTNLMNAQMAANSIGANEGSTAHANDFAAPSLSVTEALNLITVEGSAEIRVKPTQIRLVMAAVSEAENANECQTKSAELVQRISTNWQSQGIAKELIFEDFISILPIYEFEETAWKELTVLRETLARYRLQTNLHVQLTDNEQARRALKVAFESGVTDIVSFDYWSPDLESAKSTALQQAIAVARNKSKILFDPELFPKKPPVVNITESGRVILPREMYESYTNTIEQSASIPYNWRENIPRILAAKPKTTYYRGPALTGDSLSSQLPMEPEISVVSKVKLYFESPSEFRGQILEGRHE